MEKMQALEATSLFFKINKVVDVAASSFSLQQKHGKREEDKRKKKVESKETSQGFN